MTTVVFYNNVLAADSRMSVSGSTEKEPTPVNDDVLKIKVVNNGVTFRDDKVLAIAGAGVAASVARLMDIIPTTNQLEEDYLTAIKFNPDLRLSFSILIVGQKKNYVVRPVSKTNDKDNTVLRKLSVVEYTKKELVVLGSGGPAARLSVIKYGSDAITAIKDSIIGDQCSGGLVRYINTKVKNLKIGVAQ